MIPNEISRIAKYDQRKRKELIGIHRGIPDLVSHIDENGISLSHGIVGIDPTAIYEPGEMFSGLRLGDRTEIV